MATVSVFGLGYVGSVLVACLSENNHRVIGVDINPMKTGFISEGKSPIIEEGLGDLLAKGVANGLVDATTDARDAVSQSDISVICVGTPSKSNGSPDLSHVKSVCEEIGDVLRATSGFHVVMLRSTVLPGTTEDLVIPTLEKHSGKRAGIDFGVCFNPEFLREGSSIRDFYDPPVTVIGADDERTAGIVRDLYSMLSAPTSRVPFRVAEMVKYACNSFHALKVCFANEIGNLCREQGIDSHEVMEIFCQDRKLNISRHYLKPGSAFGGSCLPKDVRALLYQGRHLDLNLPVLESILPSNARQVEMACDMVERSGRKRVGVCGFSFKDGTDDLRESPVVKLIEFLLGKGYQLKVYDESVSLARLHGSNRAYINQTVPHIARLMEESLDTVLDWSEAIVIGNHCRPLKSSLEKIRADQTVIDLVRISENGNPRNGNYQGICW